LVNSDLHISLAAPRKSMTDYFYKNSQADEGVFIHEGTGTLKTGFGHIKFAYGDYLVIPRGTIYQMDLIRKLPPVLSWKALAPYARKTLFKYLRAADGTLALCERDIRQPQNLETHDEKGDFKILIKKQGLIYPNYMERIRFDFIGWDGFHYPWAFSIPRF